MTTQISGTQGVNRVAPESISADDFQAALFLASKSANGYSYLPNGLIIQWGVVNYVDISVSALISFTFPIAFPNNVFNVVAQVGNSSQNVNMRMGTVGSLTGVDSRVYENDNTVTSGSVFFFAIGR